MSTRSFVALIVNGKYRTVYVHYDGYPKGVGKEVLEYSTFDAVLEMVNHGDRSSLDGPYYKDRGEDDVDPVEYDSFSSFYEACDHAGCEWYYVFNDGQWYFGSTYGNYARELVPLTSDNIHEEYDYD